MAYNPFADFINSLDMSGLKEISPRQAWREYNAGWVSQEERNRLARDPEYQRQQEEKFIQALADSMPKMTHFGTAPAAPTWKGRPIPEGRGFGMLDLAGIVALFLLIILVVIPALGSLGIVGTQRALADPAGTTSAVSSVVRFLWYRRDLALWVVTILLWAVAWSGISVSRDEPAWGRIFIGLLGGLAVMIFNVQFVGPPL